MADPTLAHLPPFFDMVYTDGEGNLTPNALIFNDQMWQTLNQVVEMFWDGLQNPSKTTAEITVYRDALTTPVGTVWFNTSLAKLQVKTLQATYTNADPPVLITPGAIETIQSV